MTIEQINQLLSLGLAIGQLAEPGIVGIVKSIRAAVNDKGELTFEVVQELNLDKVTAMIGQEQADLLELGAELKRLKP